ncbi:MAG: hypothetical protein IT577_19710 [Verrucomicrobiae bacterium]|nr:hypothetical protein [Verrucomicrobiae bacterium]
MDEGTWNVAEMIGRLHPLLVHVPIGILLLLAILELATRGPRREGAAFARRVTLVVGAAGAVFASVFGWVLSLGGGYEGRLVLWHQNAGFGTAVAAVILLVLDRWRSTVPYRVGLALACAVMAFASHLGGSLTHGEDYLTEHLPPSLKRLLGSGSVASSPGDVYAAAVAPILGARCVDCHREGKSKGKLRMDAVGGLFAGGSEGPAIAPGNSADSLIIQRITMPEGEEGRMPPEGREGPTAAEIAVLRWWIDAGAPTNQPISELNPPAEVARAIAARPGAPKAGPTPAAATPPMSAVDAEAAAKRLSEELGIIVLPLARGEPWLEANASLAGTNFGDAQLVRLAQIGPNLKRLDLAGTAITDAGLAGAAAFPNLESLHVPRTRVTDGGLKHIGALARLESLNLYGTAVTDAGLEAISSLPGLKRVYLWQTKVGGEAARRLGERLPAASSAAGYRRQIEELQAKIRAASVEVNTGAPEIGAKPAEGGAPGRSPVNKVCPVKEGKPVDPAITAEHEGRLIGFCCEGCKAAFVKDPKAYLSKVKE